MIDLLNDSVTIVGNETSAAVLASRIVRLMIDQAKDIDSVLFLIKITRHAINRAALIIYHAECYGISRPIANNWVFYSNHMLTVFGSR